jgi:hypothetical protein
MTVHAWNRFDGMRANPWSQLCCGSGGTRLGAEYDRLHGLHEGDGNWRVGAPTTFNIGTAKGITLSGMTVHPGSVPLGGGDLYERLESKCAGRS